MKRIRYRNYFTIILMVGLFASCNKDFLENPPQDQIVDNAFYKSTEEVLAASAPLYGIVWFAYNDKASHGIGDARGGVLTSGSYQVANVQFATNGLTDENVNSWRSFYNIVGQANTLIANVTKYATAEVPDNMKQHAIAEARFMRGVAYSYLVQNWKEVPIITNNSVLLQDTSITKNTTASVWEFIIRDIRFAANTLPSTPIQKGRLTKWSAEGMLAKMYLTRAGVGSNDGSRNQADLDSAAYFANDVIDHSGASLMPNYEDLFLMKNNNNAESLFALQWTYNGTYGSQNSVQAFLAFGSSITGFPDGWGQDIGASKYMIDKYEPQDTRRKATFMFPGEHYSYIHQEVNDCDNAAKKIVKELVVPTNKNTYNVNDVEKKDIPSNTRTWVKKYVVGRPEDNDGKVTQQHTEINTYMLRYAEVLLIYAEAILDKNPGEALAKFNMVHTRAGLDPLVGTLTFKDIFKERQVEFAMEGQMWYDFVRLHYYHPDAALDSLSNQERGFYLVIPDQSPDCANPAKYATAWNIVQPAENSNDDNNWSRKYEVTEGNFYLPIPSVELSRAPNLRKTAVDYVFK